MFPPHQRSHGESVVDSAAALSAVDPECVTWTLKRKPLARVAKYATHARTVDAVAPRKGNRDWNGSDSVTERIVADHVDHAEAAV